MTKLSVVEWINTRMPMALRQYAGCHSKYEAVFRLFRAAGRYLWQAIAWIIDLLWRWLHHAVTHLLSEKGYAALGVIAGLYSFVYSLANEAYQRGELNASLRLGTFMALVSGGSRASFISGVKQIADVQETQGFEPPTFLYPNTWFVPNWPNQRVISDWALALFPECTQETCGNKNFRIDLRAAWLRTAQLSRVDFHEADLSEIDIREGDLSKSNFRNSRLTKAEFTQTDLRGANFEDASAQCSHMWRVKAGPMYEGPEDDDLLTSFSRADLGAVAIEGGNFERAIFDRANLAPAECETRPSSPLALKNPALRLQHSSIQGAKALKANFRNAILKGAALLGNDFEGADFQDADLSDVFLNASDLRGANFTGANLTGARLTASSTLSLPGGRQALIPPWPALSFLRMLTEFHWRDLVCRSGRAKIARISSKIHFLWPNYVGVDRGRAKLGVIRPALNEVGNTATVPLIASRLCTLRLIAIKCTITVILAPAKPARSVLGQRERGAILVASGDEKLLDQD
jgi:uncharacterized protein YjbI with pentapeptide repeats